MVSFRRLILAIAVLALFTGLASAQLTGGTGGAPLACAASVAAPPQLRSEGMTELIGDIVLVCTGGTPTPVGTALPTANFTVSLGTNVTSRLLGGSSSTVPSNTSEALLMIDEPGSSLAGAFPTQSVCTNSAVGAGPGGCNATTLTNGVGGLATGSASIYMGLVSGNQVVFNGVPIVAPGSNGSTVYRITNVRANANGLGGGGLQGTTQLLASVAITGGSTSLTVSNPVPIAGFVQPGLAVAARNSTNPGGSGSQATFNQCSTQTTSAALVVRFTENFAAAFKTRVVPTAGYNGQMGSAPPIVQNIPGNIYSSESNFILPSSTPGLPGGFSQTPGLADYGTRLKAVFNNIPSGVSIYVTTTNFVPNGNTASATIGTNPVSIPAGGLTGFTSVAGFVGGQFGETTPDANGQAPLLAGTQTINGNTATNIIQIPVVNGSAVAVWEVLQTNPNQTENFDFGVYISYSANVASNSPPPGQATVSLSFAPTPTQGAFSASAGSTASSSLTIPRFADTSSAINTFSIAICQTNLLFPFVTNTNGFDTGIAIANTTTDPFGTKAQAGPCVMNFYGSGAPSAVNTGNVATGTVYTTTAGVSAPNFQGYMIAQCNFQFAHGFAFISDVGARNLAMGYLALVMNFNGGSGQNGLNRVNSAGEGLIH